MLFYQWGMEKLHNVSKTPQPLSGGGRISFQAVDPTVCTIHHYPVLLLRPIRYNTSLICLFRNIQRHLSGFAWLLQVKLSQYLYKFLLRRYYVWSNMTALGTWWWRKQTLWSQDAYRPASAGTGESHGDKALHRCDENTWETPLSHPTGGKNVPAPGCWEWMWKEGPSVTRARQGHLGAGGATPGRGSTVEGALGRKLVWFWNKIKLLWDLIWYILLILWVSLFFTTQLLGTASIGSWLLLMS